MFKLSWIFGRKKDNAACSESAPEKVAQIPQHDPLDPMIKLGRIRGWNVEPEKTPVIRSVKDFLEPGLSVAMDSAYGDGPTPAAKAAAGGQNPYVVPTMLQDWYNSQGFIGHQACAIISQHWLVDKACSMSGEDAARNGWELKSDGRKLSDEQSALIARRDMEFRVKDNLVELNRFKNVFGVRIALFVVESDDPDYYEKPFNPDGITPGSYKGISQIDPYWAMPQLTADSTADPSSEHFYEPDFWIISGKKYHRSHLVVVRGPQPPDILKPTYIFGGIPLTQRIYERVYAAERTANEAPLLAMSKRTSTIHVDVEKAIANEEAFNARLAFWIANRDNHGVKVLGIDEGMEQFDTNLADFDSIIMNQYQLVAAIAKTPATKLLGTSPKGFNATGEHETISYHEELESIQEHIFDPLLERHYLLLAKSEEIDVQLEIVWNPVDSTSSQQQAELNNKKAATDEIYINSGVVSPDEVRERLRDDPRSGYNRLTDDQAETEPGMSPENLAEFEKAGAQSTKAKGEAERAEAQAGAVEGAGGPVPAAPRGTKPLAKAAEEGASEAAEPPSRPDPKAELRNLLVDLLSKLQDLDDIKAPDGVDIEHNDAPGLKRTSKPGVSGMEPSVFSSNRIVGPRDHSELQRIKVNGITTLIENPRGSIRQGKDGSWRVQMKHHYGFIKGTKGADGDEVDCFVGPNLGSKRVFVVNQVNKEGQFDEHKCMLGFNNINDAKSGYLSCFRPGWDGLGSIHEVDLPAFRRWLANGDTTKPFGGE
ncbi:hypothetical protein [Pseudomonas phage NP3]|uniref:Uncharacterized protein n=2 Tax=Pbunavirus SN TaxID=2006180 RepID=A0A142FGC8_9CAUD|nr:minor head protein [Pseudomonas phage SN]AMQ76134.1 hypothetical protein [Pseudomonas phage NP3]CAT99667.1 putative minor head protein [Pseudomonas phage SN]